LVEDLARLDAELQRRADVALVIIDPISAYIGQINSHRDSEVRAVLVPLAELAAKHDVAILAISHLRKSLVGDAVLQVMGSLAFAAAARAVFIVARDPADPRRRLFLPAKNNLGDDRTGYAFRVEAAMLGSDIATSRIAWEAKTVTITADEALALRDRDAGHAPAKRDAATQWLAGMLAYGPVAVAKLHEEADAAGYSWGTVRRAQDYLCVTAEKASFEGGWAWRLPEEAEPGQEIEL
jgi:hypothetical protein